MTSDAQPHRTSNARTGVLLVNLGTPEAPTTQAIRDYLAEFLSDPYVVGLPRLLWLPILYGVVLRKRPARLVPRYAGIWMDEGSPLLAYSLRQAAGLAQRLTARGLDVEVALAMRYGRPSIAEALAQLQARGCGRVLAVPMYPQYTASTTTTAVEAVTAQAARMGLADGLSFVGHFYDQPGYLDAQAGLILRYWQEHGRPDKLLMSFHGLPRRVVERGDPYYRHCLETAGLVRQRLGLAEDQIEVSFQSRFGAGRWLEPYTLPRLQALPGEGVTAVDVVCPGFVADCLETLEEINQDGREAFLAAGGRQFRYISALNDDPAWLEGLTELVEKGLRAS
ncbi:MAG: ferrochelatase [Bordetella sp.]|uniref:ferrochelatase n=1 Tax=Bordetella sp. TaxID=28081 RepID=UPI003F7CAB41